MAETKITVADQKNKAETVRYRDKIADQLTVIFRTDPVIRWIACDMTEEERQAYLRRWFTTITRASELNNGVFMEANDFDAVAIWLLPGEKIDPIVRMIRAGMVGVILKLGLGGLKRMLYDFQYHTDRIKARQLPKKQLYHYLFFIGTMESARGQGLASKLIRERQALAAKDGLPVWLESTTTKSRDVYARCGFEFREQLTVGKGTHDSEGRRKKGGEGVPMYAMVWWPEGTNPEEKKNKGP